MGMWFTFALFLQPLLVVTSDGKPMRFGVPVPAESLAEGLSLAGRGALQWRRLPVTPTAAGEVWIELGIVAPRGTVRVRRGGAAPRPTGRGAAFVRTATERELVYGLERTTTWRWVDGTVDERTRITFRKDCVHLGERFLAGESHTTESDDLAKRADHWLQAGRVASEGIGLLPSRARSGALPKQVRRHLGKVVATLCEMPGVRGAGDFVRDGDVVTNLEYDTTFALLRCAVAMRHERAWRLARRAARHLCDRDLDLHTGLPFGHGSGHRTTRPEPGHCWLQGLLWVGLLSADDGLVRIACGMGRALAVRLPNGVGRHERLRDYAWPLLQLESLLRVDANDQVRIAADRYAAAIAARFDPVARTWRFGEGEVGQGAYFERAWLTAGILLPAVEAHLARNPLPALRDQARLVRRSMLDSLGSGARGFPTHWRIRGGRVFGQHFERGTARSTWLLEALAPRDQQRLLRRAGMRRALLDTPPLDHRCLATEFTMLARCDWVWR